MKQDTLHNNRLHCHAMSLCIKELYTLKTVGQDSAVSIMIRYGLDGLGIESWWGQDLPHLSRPALEPTQPPIQ